MWAQSRPADLTPHASSHPALSSHTTIGLQMRRASWVPSRPAAQPAAPAPDAALRLVASATSAAVPSASRPSPAVPPADSALHHSNFDVRTLLSCNGFTPPAAASGDTPTDRATLSELVAAATDYVNRSGGTVTDHLQLCSLIHAITPPPPALTPPPEPAAAAPAYPTVGFAAPMLGLIATRTKSLDMRPAADFSTASLRPGSLFWGYQGGITPFVRLCRVLRTRTFTSPAAAFAFYRERGDDASLFPPGWCLHDGRPIRTAAEADAFYRRLVSRRATAPVPVNLTVRVLTLAPVDEAEEVPSRMLTTFPRTSIPVHPGAPSPSPARPPRRIRLPPLHVAAAAEPSRTPPRPPAPWPHIPPRRLAADLLAPPTPQWKLSSSSLPPYLPLTAAAETAVAAADAAVDSNLLERIVSDARYRARTRGATAVTARDFSAAASQAAGLADPFASPAEQLPEHYDEVVEALQRIRASAPSYTGGELGPSPRVRVLVAGEVSAVVARMFQLAGADVATCDLKPAEDNGDIPHYQGDASHIIDLGWDLVVGHPPCTYLANSGVVWLHRDPQRWDHLIANADTFRRIMNARAPFVAIENSKMHRYGRALVGTEPSQYVHPWQHGTGHTKPTALYLRNLPPLTPSCLVPGREHAAASLPPSLDRSAKRSRTYVGIAAAMALQWMPILLRHAAQQQPHRPTAAEMVAAASLPSTASCCVAFTRRSTPSHPHADVITIESALPGVISEPLSANSIWPANAVATWIDDDLLIPESWRHALAEALRYYPTGHNTRSSASTTSREITHTWIIDVSRLDSATIPVRRDPESPPLEWTLSTTALPRHDASPAETLELQALLDGELPPQSHPPPLLPADPESGLAASVDQLPRHLADSVDQLPGTRFPWINEQPSSSPPAPPPRHVRYRRGRWQAWTTDPSSSRGYAWSPLDPQLSHQLDHAVRGRLQVPPTIFETSPLSNPPLKEACLAAAAATDMAPTRQHLDLAGLRQLWDARPPPAHATRWGLGASETDNTNRPDAPTLRPPLQRRTSQREAQRRLADHYRSLHQRWQPDSSSPIATATPVYEGIATAAGPAEPAPTAPTATPAYESIAAETVAAAEADIALTPRPAIPATAHALYFQYIHLVRHAPTRHGKSTVYDVGCAVGDFARSLSDTGAGPSIATTGFLEVIPRDALVSRDRTAYVAPLVSADGSPLQTEGTATLTFSLDGTICRHTFVVVSGKPLLLFGNDFLGHRRAVIRMNESGDGDGTVVLHSESVHGRPIVHTARVTNTPRLPSESPVTAVVSADDTSPVASVTTHDSSEPTGSTAPAVTSIPLPAAELSAEALKDGTWKIESSEHLLYTQHAILLAPRAVTIARVRAPRALSELHTTCFVDRLPHRDGIDTVPIIEPVPVRIEDGWITLRIVNLSRYPVTLPASSPVARLDSEYAVLGTLNPDALTDAADRDYYAALSADEKKLVDSVVVDTVRT